MRVLVYVDSPAMVPSGSAIGRALRDELKADILMLLVDSARHRDVLPRDFTIHDFTELFSSGAGLAQGEQRTAIQRLRRVLGVAFLSPILLAAKLRGEDPRKSLASTRRRLAGLWARGRRLIGWPQPEVRAGLHGEAISPIRQFLRRFRTMRRIRALLLTSGVRRVPKWFLASIRRAIAGFHLGVTVPIRRFLLNFRVVRELRTVQSTRLYRRGIRHFLRRVKPDVIIVFEDNIETLSRILVAVGDEMGTPSAVVPYTIPNPVEPATSLVARPEHFSGRWTERLLSLCSRSHWVFEFEGKRLLRLPPSRVLAMETLGLSVPYPWILNSGSARAIALDSEMARRAYLDLGFPKEQLAVVGEPVGEQLLEGLSRRSLLRQQIAEENAFAVGDRPLLVCAFPPDQYRGTETRAYELPDFPALVEAWMKPLGEVSRYANVLVRPHPRLSTDLLEAYETDRLKITWRPTAELVPVADLYVASISATIRWAIACGVPVINYDCYRYRYGDYDKAPGVLSLFSGDDFRTAALRFFTDPTFAEELRSRQNAVRGDWGMVDAGFPKRFGALVSRIIRQQRGTPGKGAERSAITPTQASADAGTQIEVVGSGLLQ